MAKSTNLRLEILDANTVSRLLPIQPWREWSLLFIVAQCNLLSPPACGTGAEDEREMNAGAA
jgi:hypothetical protein